MKLPFRSKTAPNDDPQKEWVEVPDAANTSSSNGLKGAWDNLIRELKASWVKTSGNAKANWSDKARNAKEGAISFSKAHTKAVAGTAIAACLLVGCTAFAGGGDVGQTSTIPDSQTPLAQEAEVVENGTLSFTVTSTNWTNSADGDIAVRIEGANYEGEPYLEDYKAVPNQKYDLDIDPGTYTISLATGKPSKGDNLYKCTPQKVKFDGTENKNVVLAIELDSAKMAQLQKEAEEKAAAEKAAQEKAAAEAAAAEAARVEAEQRAQAEAAARASAAQERTVYIAASGNGERYHSNPNCSRMKGTISLTVSQAEAKGYTPCKKCY